ncbi:MAG TPA: HAMP domain-containing protein, partial [Caproiciproducens sp.]|nr:HAMP domain-containing protein [Caproiciproducens sp.]
MFKNMTIRAKLLIAFLAVAVISSIGSVYSLIRMMAPGIRPDAAHQVAQNLDQSQIRMMSVVMIIAVVISFVVSIVIALYISKNFSRRVNIVKDAAEKMSQGDLDIDITVTADDEIGRMGKAINTTISDIKGYITDLSENLNKMANGDLRTVRTVEYKGDFKKLADPVHNIVTSQNEILSQIYQVAEQVSSGSGQVSTSAQALAQGATEQASSI